MKNKHRIKQGLSLLLAGGIALTNLGVALPAFAEDAPATPENAEAVTPETAEADTMAPNLVQITENLYDDLPDAPTGSYLGSMGLPVATGETKIGISAWVSDLYDGVDAHMDADALNADENTVTIGKTPGTDYAIVPLLAQVESCSSEGSVRWWTTNTICSSIPTSAAPRTAAQPLTTTPPPTTRGTICPVHPKITNCWIWTIFCPPKPQK